MLNKSSSNPDLTNTTIEPLKRTNSSSSSLHSLTPPPTPAPENPPLYSSPSFSIYAGTDLQTEPTTQEPTQDFTFGTESESESDEKVRNQRGERRLPLFLARGLGIDRVGSGLLDPGLSREGMMKWRRPVVEMGSEEEKLKVEMELKRIVEDEPKNALALRDYAQFLCQVKGDAKRAEEYYSRAILIEPLDGEILSEYAKLVWDLHADVDRALTYFEKALTASPQNNNVFAAYAAFMWEIEETDDGSSTENFIESNFFQHESQAPSI
ncbi:hypothetical protein LUZ60_016287 [Juncus effusus]|nr:hypothetical protein LUZ60_016287 [Juncus effusus]